MPCSVEVSKRQNCCFIRDYRKRIRRLELALAEASHNIEVELTVIDLQGYVHKVHWGHDADQKDAHRRQHSWDDHTLCKQTASM